MKRDGYSYGIHKGFDQEDEGSKCKVPPEGWRVVQLLYFSDITVKPEHWNPKKEELKAKTLMDRPNV